MLQQIVERRLQQIAAVDGGGGGSLVREWSGGIGSGGGEYNDGAYLGNGTLFLFSA